MNFNYVSEALVTLSPSFHADKVRAHTLFAAMRNFIAAAEDLDLIKKALFYGRDAEFPEYLVQTDGEPLVQANLINKDVIHGIIGIATEAGELMEALEKSLFADEDFDAINMAEEIGDVFWYQAILSHIAGLSFDEIQHNNIAKLRKRFPDKFTEYDANNRDLAAERAILETVGEDQTSFDFDTPDA